MTGTTPTSAPGGSIRALIAGGICFLLSTVAQAGSEPPTREKAAKVWGYVAFIYDNHTCGPGASIDALALQNDIRDAYSFTHEDMYEQTAITSLVEKGRANAEKDAQNLGPFCANMDEFLASMRSYLLPASK